MKKSTFLLLIFILTVSGLIVLEPVYSQSITKPSVPEFSLSVAAHPNDGAPTNLEITIKNQEFTSRVDASGNYTSLYYNIRLKGHFSMDWRYYPDNRNSSYTSAATSDYTTIFLSLGVPPLGAIPAGGQVDFQVQALVGHDNKISRGALQSELYRYEFAGEMSDWSNTQTIVMPESVSSASPTPTPSLMPTRLSISADASSATVGSSVNVVGKLTDKNGNPLPNKALTLSYTVAGSGDRVPIGSGTTSTNGEYAIQWVNTASGTFTLTVAWSGDAAYEPSSNVLTLNFLPYQNQIIFLVESNSTVTALAYNSTTSKLSFSVTGASETTGYVKVTLSRSLTSYPENVKVYLDGNQLSYSATSSVDSWQLKFNYSHSAHNVAILFGPSAETPFFQSQVEVLILLGVTIAVILVATGIIGLKKRKKTVR